MLRRSDWREPPLLTEVFERDKERENMRRGREANRKGRTAEQRVLVAVEILSTRFSWLLSGRLATKVEDKRGIDVVADTPIGPLYLQVKSSVQSAHNYRRQRRKARVIVVVVEPDMSQDKLQSKVEGALCAIRGHILALRRKNADARRARSPV